MLSMPIDFWFLVYSAIILCLFLFTRQNKDSAVVIVVSAIICNVANFEYLKYNLPAHLIEFIFLEIIAIVVSFVLVKIVDWLTASASTVITFIAEVIASLGLVYIFYNVKVIINFILSLFNAFN